MKKILVLACLTLFILSSETFAQYENTGTGSGELLNGNHEFSEVSRLSKLMGTKKKKKSNLIGHPYLFEKWSRAEIDFDQEGQVTVDNVKIDLINNYLEVKYEGVEKVLDKDHFSSFKIVNPEDGELIEFVNAEDYSFEGNQLEGFLKRTKAGDMEVLVHHKAKVSSSGRSGISDYSSTMRISKKKKTYLSKDGKLYKLKRKKDLYKIFTKKQKKMKAYIKKNNLSYKKEGHLVLMALYYQEKI